MANISESRIIYYNNAKKEFNNSYKEYQEKNSNYQGGKDVDGVMAPVWSVTTEEALFVFEKLTNLIHYACMINEENRGKNLEKDDARFFSALRLIDNMMKHSKDTSLQIYEIIQPKPTFVSKIVEKKLVQQFHVEFFFGDVQKLKIETSDTNLKNTFRTQKANYTSNLKNERVLDVIKKLDELMKKYYF